jgi:hypothetical protein
MFEVKLNELITHLYFKLRQLSCEKSSFIMDKCNTVTTTDYKCIKKGNSFGECIIEIPPLHMFHDFVLKEYKQKNYKDSYLSEAFLIDNDLIRLNV